MSREVATATFAQILLTNVAGLQARFPEMNIKVPEALKALADKKSLTLEQNNQLAQALIFVYMNRTLTQNIGLLTQRQIPTAKIVSDIRQSKVLKSLIESIQDDKQAESKSEEGFRRCHTSVSRSLLAAPTAAEIKNVKDLIEKVKTSVLAVTDDFVKPSATAKAAITAKIASTVFRLPDLRTDIHAAQLRSIRLSIEEGQRQLDRIDGFKDNSLFLMLYNLIANGQEDAADNLAAECEKFEPGEMSDASIDVLKKIRVSWQTVRYPAYGATVIAHELGHVVSKALRKPRPIKFAI
jgi:hypothetical protein